MRLNKKIKYGITGFVLAASLLVFSTNRPAKSGTPVKAKKPTCCKKTQEADCQPQGEGEFRDEMILDNFSRQFISTVSFY